MILLMPMAKLDVIVNNVSVAIGGYPITDMSNEDWQKILAINFSSVFYGCKHSIPYLKKIMVVQL